MLPAIYLGLYINIIKSDPELGLLAASPISNSSMIGFQFSAARTTEYLGSASYDVNYRAQSIFYRFTLANGWFSSLNLKRREAHQRFGIDAEGTPNGDVLFSFRDQLDIDAESYLLGASIGYAFSISKDVFLHLTAVSYAKTIGWRSWATLEAKEDANNSGLQRVQDMADAFAQEIAQKDELSFLQVSFGFSF